MNFLAHFHLAWPEEALIVGGLEGDFCKGRLQGQFPAALERGIRLHRAIDAYTDAHPMIAQLRRDLPPPLRRYAGILIDLCFDHFLSLHWSNFSALSLPEFSRGVYRILRQQEGALSAGARIMADRLIEHDLLGLYLQWDTVLSAAQRIGNRFARHNPFAALEQALSPEKDTLEQAFLAFYPQLQAFSQAQVRSL